MSDTPTLDERRAFVRHHRRIDALWQMLGLGPRDMIAGRVTDVSISGVALVVDQPFAPAAHLMIRLPTATRGWATRLVRVQHCRPAGAGRYQLGCSFVRPLTPEQLEAHAG